MSGLCTSVVYCTVLHKTNSVSMPIHVVVYRFQNYINNSALVLDTSAVLWHTHLFCKFKMLHRQMVYLLYGFRNGAQYADAATKASSHLTQEDGV